LIARSVPISAQSHGNSTNSPTAPDVHFWEYNSTRVGDGKPVDVSQRAPFSKQLTLLQDATTIANYRNPAFVLGWTPALSPLITVQPAPQTEPSSQTAIFNAAALAVK